MQLCASSLLIDLISSFLLRVEFAGWRQRERRLTVNRGGARLVAVLFKPARRRQVHKDLPSLVLAAIARRLAGNLAEIDVRDDPLRAML